MAGGILSFILLAAFSYQINNKNLADQEVIPAYQESAQMEDELQDNVKPDEKLGQKKDSDVGVNIASNKLNEDTAFNNDVEEASNSGNSVNEGMAVVDENIDKDLIAKEPIDEAIVKKINNLVKRYYDTSKKLSKEIIIVDDSDKLREIDISRKAIEKYQNIKTNVKHGLEPESYVVFTTYEMKLEQIDTLAPGMSMLYIVTDERGKLLIKDNMNEEQISTYVAKLTQDEDLKAVIEDINTKLSKAVEKDKKLKEFVQYLEKGM